MSDFQQRDMTGVLFKNTNKIEDNHPDYTGSITFKGTKYNLAGWIKKSKKGDGYLSVSVSAWRGGQRRESTPDDFPEDRPF